MSKDQNIAAQERFGADVINAGSIDVIDDVVAPDFVDNDPAPDQGPGIDGFKQFWTSLRSAFPDFRVEVDAMVADEDSVAIAYRATGTHQGDFVGFAATGSPIDIRGVQVTRFRDAMMVERWGSSDQLTLLQQIGAKSLPG
ncbi:MAG: ester cyclase [Actinomycetota bacterium]|nr:ester cyclase [Actinomycetota bacterium]